VSIRTFNGRWLLVNGALASSDSCCCNDPPCSGPCDEENPCPEGCYCCDGVCQAEPCVPGCTNPNAPNYNPSATCDDGSCETCCNQGLCVLEDPDCLGNCNSLTAPNGCNPAGTTEQEGPCVDCCDSYCQNGCPDEDPPQGAPNDCHSSFAASYVVTPEMDCDGVGFTYENCFDCEFVPPP
jgi:hypothetical protein